MDADHVEVLVKKALTFSEDTPETKKQRRKKRALIFGCCAAVTALELLLVFCFLPWDRRKLCLAANLLGVFEILSFSIGIYTWFFIEGKLPEYYDVYEIYGYHNGVFQMSLPGISFNNRNWPHILKCLRLWSAASMVIMPFPCTLLLQLFQDPMQAAPVITLLSILLLAAYLAGMFIPMYAAAKKYT